MGSAFFDVYPIPVCCFWLFFSLKRMRCTPCGELRNAAEAGGIESRNLVLHSEWRIEVAELAFGYSLLFFQAAKLFFQSFLFFI